ncbi:MAG: glucosaminidase domain-containing protein [Cryomorphaceae bacterium]
MLRRNPVLILLFLTLSNLAFSNGDKDKRNTRVEYISTWKGEAIKQMREHGIPASITLAQAILESGDGNSELARKANNHFGIKCHGWKGQKSYHDDDKRQECFRKYRDANESFEDHSLFLKRSRYAFLFDYDVTDYKAWAKGLKRAGYATNPKYPALLIRIIEENGLDEYDKMALDKGYKPPKTKIVNQKSNTAKPNKADIVITTGSGINVYKSENDIKYIVTPKTLSIKQIAELQNMGKWQVRKYNDLEKGDTVDKGERIYIQPKRNKSRVYSTHTVATGETLETISQQYGVKMKKILKHSDLPRDYKVKPGDVLKLRR